MGPQNIFKCIGVRYEVRSVPFFAWWSSLPHFVANLNTELFILICLELLAIIEIPKFNN
jgi:hypothetical protein